MSTAAWAVPVYLVLFGLVLLGFAKWTSRRFDRKHPHLSRKGMREAQARSDAEVEP